MSAKQMCYYIRDGVGPQRPAHVLELLDLADGAAALVADASTGEVRVVRMSSIVWTAQA